MADERLSSLSFAEFVTSRRLYSWIPDNSGYNPGSIELVMSLLEVRTPGVEDIVLRPNIARVRIYDDEGWHFTLFDLLNH